MPLRAELGDFRNDRLVTADRLLEKFGHARGQERLAQHGPDNVAGVSGLNSLDELARGPELRALDRECRDLDRDLVLEQAADRRSDGLWQGGVSVG